MEIRKRNEKEKYFIYEYKKKGPPPSLEEFDLFLFGQESKENTEI